MDSEMPPFSYDPDQEESKLPLPEAITALLQAEIDALKQVEMASKQLFLVLEHQVAEGETLRTQMKQQRNIPRSMKKAYREQYWWDGLAGEIKGYGEQCEAYRIWLEHAQEICDEKFAAFKQLQEDVDNLYPQ